MSKRIAFYFLLIILANCFSGGCGAIATREPIYDAATETIMDARLVGTWYSQQSGLLRVMRWRCGLWMVGPASNCDASGSSEPVPIDLVRLGQSEFLFMAIPPFARWPGIGTPLIPCYRVKFTKDGKILRLRLLDTEALALHFQDHPGQMKYEQLPDSRFYHGLSVTRPATESDATQPTTQREIKNMILTDDPRRIRRFLADHANDPGLWSEAMEFGRVEEAAP